MTVRRRDILVIGGIVAAIYGLRALPWDRITGGGVSFEPIPDLPPFRRLATTGQTTGANPALIGLGAGSSDAGARRARMDAMRADPCPALFGGTLSPDILPIAYFSEFRCPFCRTLERDLDTLMVDDPGGYRLVQHELPLFGASSDLAARASVAAARQGRQQEFRRLFMRTPLLAEPAALRRVAADLGLDVARFDSDMASPGVQAELDRTRALADLFGFLGTPGLVIGRTVLTGAVPLSLLRRITDEERALPLPPC
ncbi:MAG: hypothetical protein EP307_05780 [Rhodobacteraceae bacterium]|nr:MAG: hypothetical protein EP307_05780 [Paracoccaceae bacterium]